MKKVLFLAGVLFLLSTLGFAWFRQSASYRAGPDAVTGGGGPSVSASCTAPQQALGQTAGFSNSASYRNHAGVVQPIPGPPAGPAGWQVF